jgi:hypothetical protein
VPTLLLPSPLLDDSCVTAPGDPWVMQSVLTCPTVQAVAAGDACSAAAAARRYASVLLEKQQHMEAVELYRKAGRHAEAAKLLVSAAPMHAMSHMLFLHHKYCSDIHSLPAPVPSSNRQGLLHTPARHLPHSPWYAAADFSMLLPTPCPSLPLSSPPPDLLTLRPLQVDLAKQCAGLRGSPLRTKKLHVLAGLEVDSFRRRALDVGNPDGSNRTAAATLLGSTSAATKGRPGATGGAATTAAQTLAGLMTLDAAAAGGEGGSPVDGEPGSTCCLHGQCAC